MLRHGRGRHIAPPRGRGAGQAGPGVRGRSPSVKRIRTSGACSSGAERGPPRRGRVHSQEGAAVKARGGIGCKPVSPRQRGRAAACGQGGNAPGCRSPRGGRERARHARTGLQCRRRRRRMDKPNLPSGRLGGHSWAESLTAPSHAGARLCASGSAPQRLWLAGCESNGVSRTRLLRTRASQCRSHKSRCEACSSTLMRRSNRVLGLEG